MRALLASVSLLAAAVAIGGCSNPDASKNPTPVAGETRPGGPGEPPAPAPARPGSYSPLNPQRTPQAALSGFASLYFNWDYRNLTARQETLASMSVSGARIAEQQAAASSRSDTTIADGQIANSGQVEAIAQEHGDPAVWVIVTLEQTSGSGDYEGLPPSYHVTLARAAAVRGGYAVSEWLPQS